MIKMSVPVVGGMQMEIEANDAKEVFKLVSFWQSLPTICPIDGYPTRLSFREIDDNPYYAVESTGPKPYRFLCGQYKSGGGLFPKPGEGWKLYNHDKGEDETFWPPKEPVTLKKSEGANAPLLTPGQIVTLKKRCNALGVPDKNLDAVLALALDKDNWELTTTEGKQLLSFIQNGGHEPEE